MNRLIYMDNAATTSVKPEVVESMLPYFTEEYANPSSIYNFAQKTKNAVEDARAVIADMLSADKPNEIYFTAVQAYRQHRAILYGKLRVPSVQGGVHGKTDVSISPETMLDGSLTLLMLGENQKLENTSTCKNLYRYNS